MSTQYPRWQESLRSAQKKIRDDKLARERQNASEFRTILETIYGITDHTNGVSYTRNGITITYIWGNIFEVSPGSRSYDYAIEVSNSVQTGRAVRLRHTVLNQSEFLLERSQLADAIDTVSE